MGPGVPELVQIGGPRVIEVLLDFCLVDPEKAMNATHLNEGLSRGARSSILKEKLCV